MCAVIIKRILGITHHHIAIALGDIIVPNLGQSRLDIRLDEKKFSLAEKTRLVFLKKWQQGLVANGLIALNIQFAEDDRRAFRYRKGDHQFFGNLLDLIVYGRKRVAGLAVGKLHLESGIIHVRPTLPLIFKSRQLIHRRPF